MDATKAASITVEIESRTSKQAARRGPQSFDYRVLVLFAHP